MAALKFLSKKLVGIKFPYVTYFYDILEYYLLIIIIIFVFSIISYKMIHKNMSLCDMDWKCHYKLFT